MREPIIHQSGTKNFSRWRIVSVLMLLLFLGSSSLGVAQEDSASVWKSIQAADLRVKACRAEWQRLVTIPPNPHADPTESAAKALEVARQERLTPALQAESAQAARLSAESERTGYTISSRLGFVTDMKSVRVDVTDQPPSNFGPKGVTSRFVDYSDGLNYVTFEGVGTTIPKTGLLFRDPRELLSHSAPDFGEIEFLAAWPLMASFPRQASQVREINQNTVVIETPCEIQKERFIARVAISTLTWRPFDLKVSGVYGKKSALRHYRLSGYRQYAGGIWFPSKVIVDYPGPDGTPTWGRAFSLVSVAFNNEVDLSRLTLPAGADISDHRFATPVRYKVEGSKIPSDAEVQRMIEAEERPAANLESSGILATSLRVVLVLAMVGAYLWMMRRRRRAGEQDNIA